jgi:hypothetical protein
MELSRIVGEGQRECGGCPSLREESKHLLSSRVISFLLQAEVLVIESSSQVRDRSEQIAIQLPATAEILKRVGNPFAFQTSQRGYTRTGSKCGLALVRGTRVPESFGQVRSDRIQAEHDLGTFK